LVAYRLRGAADSDALLMQEAYELWCKVYDQALVRAAAVLAIPGAVVAVHERGIHFRDGRSKGCCSKLDTMSCRSKGPSVKVSF
jgi:hypothetical protein